MKIAYLSLFGKNEQGKTTFLKAIASFDPNYAYTPSDLPNHMSARLEERPRSEIPIATLWFTPTLEDQRKLKDIIPSMGNLKSFKATKYYDNHYDYKSISKNGAEAALQFAPPDIAAQVNNIHKAVEALRGKLESHGSRQPSFASYKPQADSQLDTFKGANFSDYAQLDNLVNTLLTSLTAVPGQDQPIQDDIANAANEIRAAVDTLKPILVQDRLAKFVESIPRFIFHSSSVDKIPNEVNLADFLKDPERVSRGMANLCKAAGLSIQRITELANMQDNMRRQVYEDTFKRNISGGINEFWTQENYEVHFQFQRERLTVSISDETYTWRIPPSDRSEGFQWYLSFYSTLLSAVSDPRATVLLLDNPGLELHADGQRDIKRFLEEKLPTNTQIVYVTHSSAMIDAYHLEQVRVVELLAKEQGTKVRRLQIKSGVDSDLLEPVRSAIGASLVTSLMFNEYNILVEGAADRPILEGAFAVTQSDAKEKLVINGSIAESKDGLPLLYERAKLPYVVYLDADSAGRTLATNLEKAGIPKSRIAPLAEAVNRKGDFELEDVLSDAFYHRAVSEAYSERQIAMPPGGQGKRTKRYDALFREQFAFEFSKRRVADTVKSLLLNGDGDQETLAALKQVTDKLLGALRDQVTPKTPAGQ